MSSSDLRYMGSWRQGKAENPSEYRLSRVPTGWEVAPSLNWYVAQDDRNSHRTRAFGSVHARQF